MQAMRAAAIMLMTVASFASAQQFPVKPIRVIVPYTPGGGNDFAIRTISQKLTESWGQQIIIENRAGAEGNLGTAYAARAAADGYTILHVDVGALCINPLLFSDVGFDTQKDFLPITMTTEQPYLVIVHPSVPAKTSKDLIALAKTRNLNYGTPGTGGAPHLMFEHLSALANVRMTHIPFAGAAQALTAALSNQTELAVTTLPPAVSLVTSNKLKGIVVTGASRSSALPDVPTAIESGFPNFDVTVWGGFFVPAKTPQAVSTRLGDAILKVAAMPDIKQKLEQLGFEPTSIPGDKFQASLAEEMKMWNGVIENAGLKGK